MGVHPSHQTRISMGASTYDEICDLCGATDELGSWGRLAEPCPGRSAITLVKRRMDELREQRERKPR